MSDILLLYIISKPQTVLAIKPSTRDTAESKRYSTYSYSLLHENIDVARKTQTCERVIIYVTAACNGQPRRGATRVNKYIQ